MFLYFISSLSMIMAGTFFVLLYIWYKMTYTVTVSNCTIKFILMILVYCTFLGTVIYSVQLKSELFYPYIKPYQVMSLHSA